MMSLMIGLIAAVAWGVHDICVRYVSQRGGILPALAAVLIGGVLLLLPISVLFGDWAKMNGASYGLSLLSGAIYLVGCIGLYKCLSIGPVRLVAPIMGAYPILSIAWAALRGQAVSLDQWLAVGVVIGAVGVVSVLSDQEESQGAQAVAIAWALLGAAGFAMAFAVGHIATQAGSELPVALVTRFAAALGALVLLMLSKGAKIPERRAWPFLAMMGVLDTLALGAVVASGNLARPEYAAVAASTFGIITIILAWAFMKERMSAGQWGGVVLCFLGIGYLAL